MKKIILAISILSLGLVSCDNDLESINKNPNNPEEVPAYTLFSFGNRFFVDNTRNEWGSGRMILPWIQYWAQVNYTEEDRYQYRAEANESLWKDYYRAAENLKNSIETIEKNPSDNERIGGNIENQIAVARIMLSYLFMQLTDTYGNVPYWSYGSKGNPNFQALQINTYINPKFATQTEIYTDILKELKEASAQLNTSARISSAGDNIYNGDISKWKKFANSLRLRLANRVKEVIPSALNEANDAIAQGVFTSNSDNAIHKYGASSTDANPMWRAFFVSNRTDFAPTNTFVDLLKGKIGSFNPDPRLQKFAAPKSILINSTPEDPSIANVKDGNYTSSNNLADYEGMPYGVNNNIASQVFKDNTISFASYDVLNASRGEVLMEYAEVEFILSELNGWDNTHYQSGVRASMEKWGVNPSDINTYIASLVTANEENVMTQKYIALYMQPYEAWAEYRRTGYPKTLLLPNQEYTLPVEVTVGNVKTNKYTFIPLVAGITDVPTRVAYPLHLSTLNSANLNKAIEQMGGNTLSTKLIWDKN